MGRGSGTPAGSGRQRRSRRSAFAMVRALFCALALIVLTGSLIHDQPQSVRAAPSPSFYGIPASAMVSAADPGTPTSDTPTPTPALTNTPTPAPTATPMSPYALNVSGAAAAAGWPQSYSNWCGIATIALVANYLGNGVSQDAIYNMINSQDSQSMWGYPPPSSSYWGPYLAANISGDFGTDPRSLAKGMTMSTGRLYHVKVGLGGAWDTTIHIVRDLLASRQPISVIVDHGMHSVIVSGVEATDDPVSNPNSITAIHVWDPGGGVNQVGIQASMEVVVPIATWLSGTIAWSGSSYFKYPYAANVFQGKALDPDPAVGPYAYVPSRQNHLWVGYYVYISPMASASTASLSPDWELDQNGTLIAGLENDTWPNLPDGYTGASIPMPAKPPPPPPPVKPPVVAPKKAPLPPPRPTPTPRAPATATAMATATAPMVAPIATSQQKAACTGLSCAFSAMRNDTGLLLVVLLLLLLSVMWFPAAIMVARVHLRRSEKTKEEMQATLAASDLAADNAPTLSDWLASNTDADGTPSEMIDTIPMRATSLAGDAQPGEARDVPPPDSTV